MVVEDSAAIGSWCLDALAVFAPDLPSEFVDRRIQTIKLHSGKASILEVAKDLAEGLSHLPSDRRLAANESLKEKHGFGLDYFIGRNLTRLAQIVARGIIRTESEHRAALDALSDTATEQSLASALKALIVQRERQLSAT